MATIVVLILFFAFWSVGNPDQVIANAPSWVIVFFPLTGLFIWGLSTSLSGWIFSPLQRTAELISPRLIQCYRNDGSLLLCRWIATIFLIVSFACLPFLVIAPLWTTLVWGLLAGISLDALFFQVNQTNRLIDPYHGIELLNEQAKKSIRAKDEDATFRWADSLAEASFLTLERSSLAFSGEALTLFNDRTCEFIEGFKIEEGYLSELSRDDLYYSLLYFLQRYDLIFAQAIDEGVELLASQVILSLGNLTRATISRDMQSAPLPLHFLGHSALIAQKAGMSEVGVKATIAMQEIARGLIRDPKTDQPGMTEVFEDILHHQHEIARETFREDKETPLNLLTQPFKELKAAIDNPPSGEKHPKSEECLQMIDQVLAEFSELELILMRMPNIEGLSTEEEQPVLFTGMEDVEETEE